MQQEVLRRQGGFCGLNIFEYRMLRLDLLRDMDVPTEPEAAEQI